MTSDPCHDAIEIAGIRGGYAGPTSFETQLTACAVLVILIVGSLVAVGVLAFLIARICRKREETE
jgi:hypothetical protein